MTVYRISNPIGNVTIKTPTAPPTRAGTLRYRGKLNSVNPILPIIITAKVRNDGFVKNATTTETAIARENRKLNLN